MKNRASKETKAADRYNSAKARKFSVFLSYARKDGKEVALRLRGDLEEKGFDVWLDTARIEGGGSWTNEIEQAIDKCDAMLALISSGSFESHVCRAEQLRALRKEKRVIPLLVHTSSDRPLYLEHLNYRDLSDSSRYPQTLNAILEDLSSSDLRTLPERLRKTYVTVPALPPTSFPA